MCDRLCGMIHAASCPTDSFFLSILELRPNIPDQKRLSTSSLHCWSASEAAEKGVVGPLLVVKTLFQRGFQATFQGCQGASKEGADAQHECATAIASSATWLRVRLPVVMNQDALGSRTGCGAQSRRVRTSVSRSRRSSQVSSGRR